MSNGNSWEEMTAKLVEYLPNLLGAILILVVGGVVAMVVAAVVRSMLGRTGLDEKIGSLILGKERAEKANISGGVSKVIFYLIIAFVLVAFFQALGLTLATEPINEMLTRVFEFLPRLIGAVVLLAVAWVVATMMRIVVTRVLGAIKLDERLGEKKDGDEAKGGVSKSLGDIVYWLIFLLFLPAVLGALKLEGLLEPVRGMTDQFLSFLPNVFAALVIGVVGWFVARLVQRILTSLLAAAGIDKLSDRMGIGTALGERKLSGTVGLVVYVFILIPVLIAALNALKLDAVTKPASNMLNLILGAIPSIFAATLIVVIAYVVGRVVSGMVANVLAGVGFDGMPAKLGFREPAEGRRKPSEFVGWLILTAIMLFAAIEASSQLGFTALAGLVSELTVFAGQIVLGLLILAVGLWLANMAAAAIKQAKLKQAGMLATVARVAILGLAAAIGLQRMGLADEIVNLAFGLLLGAAAVAAALAFGLGGRDAAAKKLRDWMEPK